MNTDLHILPYLEWNLLMRPVRGAIYILQALALCDLVRIPTTPCAPVLIVGGDLDALQTGHNAEAGCGHGEVARVVVVAGRGVRGAGEGAEVEDAPEEGPAVGGVGDKDGCAGFADIPERPDWAEGLREGVIFI